MRLSIGWSSIERIENATENRNSDTLLILVVRFMFERLFRLVERMRFGFHKFTALAVKCLMHFEFDSSEVCGLKCMNCVIPNLFVFHCDFKIINTI